MRLENQKLVFPSDRCILPRTQAVTYSHTRISLFRTGAVATEDRKNFCNNKTYDPMACLAMLSTLLFNEKIVTELSFTFKQNAKVFRSAFLTSNARLVEKVGEEDSLALARRAHS